MARKHHLATMRPSVELLEDRLVPSWGGVPPGTISVPTGALAINLSTADSAQGNASIARNEIDYYSLAPSHSGSYRLSALSPGSNLDTVLAVFSSTGQRLAYNDDISTNDRNSRLDVNLQAGQQFYVGITNYVNTRGGNYTWSVSPAIQVDDRYEDNDSPSQAADLGTLTATTALTNLAMYDQADWFRFTMSGSGTSSHAVSISFQHSQGDLDMVLYNASGTRLRSSCGIGNGETISLNGLVSGTYSIHIYGYRGAFNPSYSLTINPAVNAGPQNLEDWVNAHVQDAGLRSLVLQLESDRNLGRSDMLAVFQQTASDGIVSSTEYADLRTIVANPTILNIPDYVGNLAGKVVNGDPANARYQGSTLGNLQAGSRGSLLTTLVSKWFLGTDHPQTSYAYQRAAGVLFSSAGPGYPDVRQGALGDCYLLAAMGETALRAPQLIRSMFIDNGDQTWTVRYYVNGGATYVTVDRYLPTNSSGRFIFANYGDSVSNPSEVLWVALAEKGYVQLNESGVLGRTWASSTNSYSAIAGGYIAHGLRQISGSNTLLGRSLVFNDVVNAWNSGKLIGFASRSSGAGDNIVGGHAYALVGYNAAARTFTVFNPWGLNNGHDSGLITLSWDRIVADFSYWDSTV
jgi:hypothetical protein